MIANNPQFGKQSPPITMCSDSYELSQNRVRTEAGKPASEKADVMQGGKERPEGAPFTTMQSHGF